MAPKHANAQSSSAPLKHNITKDLASLAVPIDTLLLDPSNARGHTEDQVLEIAKSYAEHGQRKPIVVQLPGNVVRSGNGQLTAAKQLGWTHIAAVFVEETDAQAKRFALRDNRLGELSEWNFAGLSEALKEISEAGLSVSDLGWMEHELEPFLKHDYTPGEFDHNDPGPEPGSKEQEAGKTVVFTAEQWDVINYHIEKSDGLKDVLKQHGLAAALVEAIAG